MAPRPRSLESDVRSTKFGREGCAPTDLTTRSNNVIIPPAAVAIDIIFPARALLLPGAESEQSRWRLVDLFTNMDPGRVFEAELTWSAGTGGIHKARMTVPRATRVCVFARTIKIEVFNFYDAVALPEGNSVGCAISDGMDPTRNNWEYRGSPGVGLFPDSLFPTFAQTVRLELDDPMAWATSYLRFYDESGIPRSTIYANEQPDVGIPVGDIAALEIKADSRFRLLWALRT